MLARKQKLWKWWMTPERIQAAKKRYFIRIEDVEKMVEDVRYYTLLEAAEQRPEKKAEYAEKLCQRRALAEKTFRNIKRLHNVLEGK